MPLTPKGYCDWFSGVLFVGFEKGAEMPLTPKGYCDSSSSTVTLYCFPQGRNAPNAERLL